MDQNDCRGSNKPAWKKYPSVPPSISHQDFFFGIWIMQPNKSSEGTKPMFNINSSTTICKPIGMVFDFMSTPENDFQWQYGTLESYRLAESASNTGTFFRSIDHLMGRRNNRTFEVTEYEPNKKYGFKSLSGPLQIYTTFTFETSKGYTKVNISTQAIVVNFVQATEAVLKQTMGKQLKDNLAMLKKILEASDPVIDRRVGFSSSTP